MDIKDKTIGIWGFGAVGKSAIRYFYPYGNTIEVLDNRELDQDEKKLLESKNIPFFVETARESFLSRNDIIFPSPGINLKNFSHFRSKVLTELDVIGQTLISPVVGITGSVGKTTVTHLLSHVLKNHMNIWTGGNIGTPMLDVLSETKKIDLAVLEISSFQLEHCNSFSPDLAIWTNFYPNHLDWHTNLKDYFNAKKKLIATQNENQNALLPFQLLYQLKPLEQIKSKLHFFSLQKPEKKEIKKLRSHDTLFYMESDDIICLSPESEKKICTIKNNHITFDENMLILASAIHILDKNKELTTLIDTSAPKLEHRLEKVATIKGVDFYNDSKSTTSAATLAAVNKLSDRPIILFLGGLNKGVNRSDLIKQVKQKVKTVYSFGKEANQIKKICDQESITCYAFDDLNKAVKKGIKQAKPGDQLLLSPAGSSFDLFADYQERGKEFKALIKQLKKYN